jgi:hypothetical protein
MQANEAEAGRCSLIVLSKEEEKMKQAKRANSTLMLWPK